MKCSAPTTDEFKQVMEWVDSQPNIPENILTCLKKILSVYLGLVKGAGRAKQVLHVLRQAMGITPKSERGSQDTQLAFQAIDLETQRKIDEIKQKKALAENQKRSYQDQLDQLIPRPKIASQLEFDLESPGEMMFSCPFSDRKDKAQREDVARMAEFGKDKGLRSTFDTTKRMNLEVIATEITYQVETVEDLETGKKVRASMVEQGPEQFQMTWKAIANLIKMHVGFAIPMNRMALMIGQPEFSTSKMCRIFEYVARELLPVYLVLAEMLSDASHLSGDDTPTKVIELDEPHEESLASQIDQHLNWAAHKRNGEVKKSLNVSLLIGKTDKDPRSTIRFFRTHTGSVGNLLSKLLEWRKPRLKRLVFQGDLSTTNLPRKDLQETFEVLVAGCAAHARRPFWKHREVDPDLCYFMLRGFLMLSQIEKRIDLCGRCTKSVLKYRNRYGRMVWQALYNRCQSSLRGEVMSRIPPKFGIQPNLWPPGTELHRACKYVVSHFEELTHYLVDPKLHYTNNGSERALRIEKCMLSGSKFRKTRNGRAVLDVLRTINATCTAARVDITDYLKYVFKNINKMQSSPDQFTPFAVALELEKAAKTVPENQSKPTPSRNYPLQHQM